jgi:hypothetical protein
VWSAETSVHGAVAVVLGAPGEQAQEMVVLSDKPPPMVATRTRVTHVLLVATPALVVSIVDSRSSVFLAARSGVSRHPSSVAGRSGNLSQLPPFPFLFVFPVYFVVKTGRVFGLYLMYAMAMFFLQMLFLFISVNKLSPYLISSFIWIVYETISLFFPMMCLIHCPVF